MIMKLHTQGLQTFDQVQAFLKGSQGLDLEISSRHEAYEFIGRTLRQFRYPGCSRAQKGLVRAYLGKVTGLSRAQITRLIGRWQASGRLCDRRGPPAKPFARRYTDADVRALADLDALHGTLSGPATRKLCERAYHVFGERRYQRLADISNGHLYNLRACTRYRRRRGRLEHTRASPVRIAERRRPQPQGQPGYLRVDSVHQGDLDGIKGLFHINLIDEVTQFQFIGSVPALSENHLLPVLAALIEAFPFPVQGFHADNGSEYINHRAAALLKGLQVKEFTKSRPRRSTDNALVESKNASVVRKHLGYGHIPRSFAARVNDFAQNQLSPYLNFHRPCLFATESVDAKGRRCRHYRYADLMTPYDKLKSLPEAERYLKPGLTFKQLDAIAHAVSDNAAARQLNQARDKLFHSINHSQTSVA